MKRSETRILTTHTGSLIRPPSVAAFDQARRQGETVDEQAYDEALRQAVADVVRDQHEAGIDVVDDGEFSKASWATYINQRISGFQHDPDRYQDYNFTGRDSTERFPEFFSGQMGGVGRWRGADVCVGPIEYTDNHSIHRDITNLKAAMEGVGVEEGFLPVAAPASAAFNGVNDYYPTEEEYIYALAEALRVEYLAIYEAGLLVQVDDAVLANVYDDLMERGGRELYRKWADLRIEALNHALRGIPEDRVRYHLCFGSWHAPHVADAPLDDIVDLILRVNAGAYSIEAANVRHEHEWRVWEDVKLPEGKLLIPGVVTHHTTSVEHPRLVADRIVRYANIVGRENVIAGTDCGFQQGAGLERAHPKIIWAKFQALAEGARIASEELWA